ncbi:MAG: heavy metal-binding domain-containing protein [Candidatus Cloacimonetes bacterium]|jgi:uncharacterized protein YbjQ (UPF0145 family)|nr:heavy metal-binding domain-containing protein [Candidatus Cloacimonadota bacterium]MBT4333702.1 heavy metal-binding domain-containing protein [Candidatus Cloacimonadota bacterium]MBT4576484.1 heavy metal-binding domain-containing protein [Candidatus Cloacimonadota bacterium]
MKCSKCGKPLSVLNNRYKINDILYCQSCKDLYRLKEKENFPKVKAELEKIIITTTVNVEGYKVEKYLGIESVEIVIGTGPISELVSDFNDFFGQRSTKFEKKLQVAKQMAFSRLKQKALDKSANAIIGIDIDYTEFTGNRIGLIVNGTLVHIVPVE